MNRYSPHKTSRVIASHPHLRVLFLLNKTSELTARDTAAELRLHHSVAARHLIDLEACGISCSTVKANERLYSLSSASDTLGSHALEFLKPHLPLLDYSRGVPPTATLIINAATGFTYARRIDIYAFISRHPGQTAGSIAHALEIPLHAVRRHLTKLSKRDFIGSDSAVRGRLYSTKTPRSTIHKAYAKLILKWFETTIPNDKGKSIKSS
jgi:predicted ArsR family transcriptional regulator